jgi:hypothetical protein
MGEYNYLKVPDIGDPVPLAYSFERIIALHLHHDHGMSRFEVADAMGKSDRYTKELLDG